MEIKNQTCSKLQNDSLIGCIYRAACSSRFNCPWNLFRFLTRLSERGHILSSVFAVIRHHRTGEVWHMQCVTQLHSMQWGFCHCLMKRSTNCSTAFLPSHREMSINDFMQGGACCAGFTYTWTAEKSLNAAHQTILVTQKNVHVPCTHVSPSKQIIFTAPQSFFCGSHCHTALLPASFQTGEGWKARCTQSPALKLIICAQVTRAY